MRIIGVNCVNDRGPLFLEAIACKHVIRRVIGANIFLFRVRDCSGATDGQPWWRRAKAAELLATPEFDDLYQRTLKAKLNDMERAAYALALDMDMDMET